MEILGKIVFRPLIDTDLPSLKNFCEECKKLGWENNESFESIKLDKMKMPYGQFFVGVIDEKIVTFAGVHQFKEINNKAWRCLFRGAQLPGYTPSTNTNIFKSWIHLGYLLYYQIKFIQDLDNNSEFYITTNIDNKKAGVSSRLDKILMPKIEKQGIWNHYSQMALYGVDQNIWKINVSRYMELRSRIIPS